MTPWEFLLGVAPPAAESKYVDLFVSGQNVLASGDSTS